MKIHLDPETHCELLTLAKARTISPQDFALGLLRQRILPKVWHSAPRDEFEQLLREVGIPCGVGLTDDHLSRESLYD